jgi:hypothetical protein
MTLEVRKLEHIVYQYRHLWDFDSNGTISRKFDYVKRTENLGRDTSRTLLLTPHILNSFPWVRE